MPATKTQPCTFLEPVGKGRIARITSQLKGTRLSKTSALVEEFFDDERTWRALLNAFSVWLSLGGKSQKFLVSFIGRSRSKPGLSFHVIRRCSFASLPFRLDLRDVTDFALNLLERVHDKIHNPL